MRHFSSSATAKEGVTFLCLQTTSLGYQGHTFKLAREDETYLFLSRITRSHLAHIAYSRTQL